MTSVSGEDPVMTNVLGRTSGGFERGFNDQQAELAIDSLEVKGAIPGWLSGALVRNGPARFRLGDKTLNHWFDGLAMLHKFDIADGRVSYAQRLLDTPARRGDAGGKRAGGKGVWDPN